MEMEMEMGGSKREKKTEMVVEMGGLSEDLVIEIFDRTPIKQVTRMKCVSKGWCHSISEYRRSRPRSSNSNLVCHKFTNVDEEDSQVIFYNIKEQVDQSGEIVVVETLENHSLSFSIQDITFQLSGSSNGLILCQKFNFVDCSFVPYVCNPILNQWVPLPSLFKGKSRIRMGLAFDGIPQRHFKVVLFCVDYVLKCTKFISRHIYSSNTGKWRLKTAKLFNSSILTDYLSFKNKMSYLYRKGMVHWLFTGYMLVYNFEKDFFKIVKLPTALGCVWESEGYLHFCHGNVHGFSIWKFVEDEVFDTQYNDEDTMAMWQQKHTIELSLEPQFLENVGHNYLKRFPNMPVKLLGFDEDLQILYFVVLETPIFSYSFETRRLKKVSPYETNLSKVWVSFVMQPSGVKLPLGLNPKR